MTKEELKDKYSAFIAEISEIMGLGKPIDILKLCATTDLFFRPLENRITDLEKENAELKADNDARRFAMAMSEKVEKQLRKEIAELKRIINNDVDKKIYVQLAKKAELADMQKDQLTKAKELLKEFNLVLKERGLYHNELYKRTEQFLKDSEVEK